MAQEWDIKPRGENCAACQRPFDDGEAYQAALFFGADGYTRADYCAACWPSAPKPAAPYSLWRGVFRKPPPPPAEPLKKETAESLLRRLIQDGEEATQNVRFILTVMLERKRILIERDTQSQPDGTLVRIYEHRGTGETFVINDPRLGFDQIEAVQQEVMALLGLREAADTAAAPEPPPPAPPPPGAG